MSNELARQALRIIPEQPILAPNGKRITDTREVIPYATASLNPDSLALADDRGSPYLEFEYTGDTDIDWDSQRTVARGGERIFVDEDGGEWTEAQILDAYLGRAVDREPAEDYVPVGDLTLREHATVLAALRYWQREGLMSSGMEQDIATNGDTLRALTAEEIDALCERINCT